CGDAIVPLLRESIIVVHFHDYWVHLFDGCCRWLDNDIDAVVQNVQIGVGNNNGYFNQCVNAGIEPGHFRIEPDHIAVLTVGSRRSWFTCLARWGVVSLFKIVLLPKVSIFSLPMSGDTFMPNVIDIKLSD